MRLLLLNGVYGAEEHFDALRAALAPEIETAVFPFRREGLSDPTSENGFAPMVERLDRAVAKLTPRETEAGRPAGSGPALLGFSLGAALALEYTLVHPQRVSALILINAFARYQRRGMRAAALPMLKRWSPRWASPAVTARIIHGWPWMRRGVFHHGMPLEAVERGVRAATREVTHSDLRFQLAHLDLDLPPGHADRLKALAEHTPVLIASSRHDAIVPPHHSDWLASQMPAARRLSPFEGGHASSQHDSGALAAAVREFLGGMQP